MIYPWMNAFLKELPRLKAVTCKEVQPPPSFPLYAASHSNRPGTVVLLSGTSLDCARYNILAIDPWLTISSKSDRLSLHLLESANPPYIDCDDHAKASRSFKTGLVTERYGDPLVLLDAVISHYKKSGRNAFSHVLSEMGWESTGPLEQGVLPIVSGLFGYLSYDLKDHIEVLPNTCMDQHLPDLYLTAPSKIHIHDRVENRMFILTSELVWPEDVIRTDDAVDGCRTESFHTGSFSIDAAGFRSNFTRSEYISAVQRIIEYIRAGDIYQVNLSQRFSAGFQGDAYALFLKLFENNPAPFFAYVNVGEHQVISTSPERFLLQRGHCVETRPIKGTIQRGRDPKEDEAFGETLQKSRKDDAELSMIVDLMRNDLGKVAQGGSVIVKEHKRLEPYDNVFHLVSIVEGSLDPEKGSVDLIRATFPGGSITGCPKIRSMEIIDELESVRRHVYTGSIGYISFHDTMDLSIAIRTAVVAEGEIGFSVGGGIVFDSDPEKEYEETLHKGKTLMETLVDASADEQSDPGHCVPAGGGLGLTGNGSVPLSPSTCRSPWAWVNGKFVPDKNALIPANYPGLQYGAGLFETLRVENGNVLRLSSHLDRLEKSWCALFDCRLPIITWENVVQTLLELNGLTCGVAALKIMVVRGNQKSLRGDQSPSISGTGDWVALFARPYTHRLEWVDGQGGEQKTCPFKRGLRLVTYPEKRETPLAAHKSMNYLYYALAGSYAKERGYDEAMILNGDGSVSETNTCALIAVKDRQLFLPESNFALPSVTLAAAMDLFSRAGYDKVPVKMRVDDLKKGAFGAVYLLNALMGVVPVSSLDETALPLHGTGRVATCLCRWLNRGLDVQIDCP